MWYSTDNTDWAEQISADQIREIEAATRQRRKWTIPACAAVLACTTVVFATVGSSRFRSETTQIHVINDTGALALTSQEVIEGRMRLQFKNISAKDLNGFVLGLANLRQ